MKRSQMEIMGLAIIVIIISLGLLFVIIFTLRPDNNTIDNARTSLLAGNFLNTLVETNAKECQNTQFKRLFMDCAENPPNGRIKCNDFGDYSCNYIQEKTAELLALTFDKWYVDYYFYASTDIEKPDETKIIEPIGQECEKGYKVGKQPLPGNPGVNLVIKICD